MCINQVLYLQKEKRLTWWATLLSGAVKRNAAVCFGLHVTDFNIDGAEEGFSSTFVARKIAMYETG